MQTIAFLEQIPPGSVDMADCAGTPLFHFTKEDSVTFYGEKYDMEKHYYVYIRDGYAYRYVCSFPSSDEHFADLTSLFSSTDFPVIRETPLEAVEGLLGRMSPLTALAGWLRSAVIGVLTAAVLVVGLKWLTMPLLLFRFAIRRRAMSWAASLVTVVLYGGALFTLFYFLFSTLTYGTALAGGMALAWGIGMYFPPWLPAAGRRGRTPAHHGRFIFKSGKSRRGSRRESCR